MSKADVAAAILWTGATLYAVFGGADTDTAVKDDLDSQASIETLLESGSVTIAQPVCPQRSCANVERPELCALFPGAYGTQAAFTPLNTRACA